MRPPKHLYHVRYDFVTDYSSGRATCEFFRDEPLSEEDCELVERAIAEARNFPVVVVSGWDLINA